MTRRRTLAAVFALLAVPPLVAAVAAIDFHRRNRNDGVLISSGERREYLLHVPPNLDPTRPVPLVVSLHGGKGWPANQRDVSGWNRHADRHGFLVVYPAAVDGVWRVTRDEPGLVRDVRFVADLLDALAARFPLDPDRIYVDGLSNGGGMAFVLSCSLSDRLAAVGLVASAQMLPWSWCREPPPLPMIAFHGTADRITPYAGGTSWVVRRPLPSIEDWTAAWAARNRCAAEPQDTTPIAGVRRRSYGGCAEDASVVLVTLEGGGHTWPGGLTLPEWFLGPTSRAVDATAELWAFFAQHPRTRHG